MEKAKQMVGCLRQELVEMFTEQQEIEVHESTLIIYKSQIFNKVIDAENGLYMESSAYVYGVLEDELEYGVLCKGKSHRWCLRNIRL